MFGFLKKEKKIEDLVRESFDKVIELTKNGEHEAATKETDKFTKLLEELPGNEKWGWYDKLTTAIVETVNNSENADDKENKESKSVSMNDIDDNDEDSQDEEIKIDGSETARQNKIKETLIDPNPLYTKWYNYFWKNKLHEDAQAKKFCPRCYYVMYNKEHRIWNGIDLTENDWNMTVGCIYGDIAPVLNFEAICTIGIRPEFTCLYAKLASLIDENKIRGLCTYIDFDKNTLDKEFSTLTQDQLESYDIRYNKCNLSIDSKKAQEYSSDSVFLLIKKWEAFCPSPIYDINPETDTEERYWERRNALIEVYNIFYKYSDYNKDLSKAFAIATEYFEFVEQNYK